MAIIACETFTLSYCFASHLGGTLLARLSDGAILFLPRGLETNKFRNAVSRYQADEIDYLFKTYKDYKRDKYATVHKQGHYIQLHNRPLGDKPKWANVTSSQRLLDL